MSIRNAVIIWATDKLRLVAVEFNSITDTTHHYIALEEFSSNALNESAWHTLACYEPDMISDNLLKRLIQCLIDGTSPPRVPSVALRHVPVDGGASPSGVDV